MNDPPRIHLIQHWLGLGRLDGNPRIDVPGSDHGNPLKFNINRPEKDGFELLGL